MGTSLSGLTPATTFDGLLKVGDNDPLTATLKAISTGDGTDTILSLSDSALKISGTGNTANDIPFSIVNSDGTELLRIQSASSSNTLTVPSARISNVNFVSGNVIAGNNTNLRLVPQQGGVSINKDYSNADASTMLHIKGSGATSATTSLLVQNSAGATAFQVDDGGNIGLGNAPLTGIKVSQTSGAARFRDLYFGNIGSSAINNGSLTSINWNGSTGIGIANSEALAATAMLHVKGSGNDNTTTSLLVQNSDGADLMEVTDNGILKISTAPSFNTLNIYSDGINDLKRIGTGTGLSIGTSVFYAAANTQVHIKGQGATSATTALLVQNSAGTDIFKVNDAGQATASGSMTAGYFSAGTSILGSAYARVRNTKLYPSQSGTGINIQADATNNPPDASAVLQADSTAQGFLPPRMTDAEKNAIATPAAGLMVYDTDANQMSYWNGGAWVNF